MVEATRGVEVGWQGGGRGNREDEGKVRNEDGIL